MRGVSDNDLKKLILSVGTHASQRPLSPAEVSDLIATAIVEGSTREECASRLSIGTTQVASFLKLQDVDPDLRHLATWRGQQGGIAFSSLALVAQLPDKSEQQSAAELILEKGLTWKETVQLIQIARRAGIGIEQATERVLDLRPEVDTRHVVIGSVKGRELQDTIEYAPQADRDRWIGLAISNADLPPDVTGRLGPKTFTLVASRPIDPDIVEKALNDRLRQIVLG